MHTDGGGSIKMNIELELVCRTSTNQVVAHPQIVTLSEGVLSTTESKGDRDESVDPVGPRLRRGLPVDT